MTHADYRELVPLAALDALDGGDADSMRDHLSACSECQTDLDAWWVTASALALTAPAAGPSVQVRERVIKAVNAESKPAAKVLEFERKVPRGSVGYGLKAAAAIVILVLLVGVIALWFQNQQAKNEITRLAAQIMQVQQSLDHERGAIAALTRPGTRINELSGTKDAPNARALLAFDATSGRAVFVANGLPQAPEGKAYQLWFMVGSRPLPGGVFKVDPSGSALTNDQLPPEALASTVFAVTLEPSSGVSAPTGDIYLLTPSAHSSSYYDPLFRAALLM